MLLSICFSILDLQLVMLVIGRYLDVQVSLQTLHRTARYCKVKTVFRLAEVKSAGHIFRFGQSIPDRRNACTAASNVAASTGARMRSLCRELAP